MIMSMHAPKILAVIVLAVLLAPSVAALTELDYGTHDISVTLQSGQDAAYLVPMKAGDRLIVDLAVTSGGPADFYLTNITAYNVYAASVSGSLNFPSLYYLGGQSSENCQGIVYTYDSLIANDYVLLMDNTANTEAGAAPVGPVTITGTITVERNVWTLVNIIITILIIICIILFMLYLRWPEKKA